MDPSYTAIYRINENNIDPKDYINDANRLKIYLKCRDERLAPHIYSQSGNNGYQNIYRKSDISGYTNFINDTNVLTSFANKININNVYYSPPPLLSIDSGWPDASFNYVDISSGICIKNDISFDLLHDCNV